MFANYYGAKPDNKSRSRAAPIQTHTAQTVNKESARRP
jgi:hypothetical protein